MFRGLTRIPFQRSFEINDDCRSRGHSFKLKKKRCETDLRQHFFSERVINRWNSLDNNTVESTSLNSFKNKIAVLNQTRKAYFGTETSRPVFIFIGGKAKPGEIPGEILD